MKVAIVHRNGFDAIGGAESTVYNMAVTLHHMNYDAVVVAANKGDMLPKERNSFCEIYRYKSFKTPKLLLPFSPYFEHRNAIKRLKDIIKQINPDIIITRDNMLADALIKCYDSSKIIYIPLVMIKYYNTGIRSFSGVKSFLIELFRWCQLKIESFYQSSAIKKLERVVVFSHNMEKQLKKSIVMNKNVQVIYPGVIDRVMFSEQYDYSVHDEMGIPRDKKIFLFVGRVVQEKNVRMMVEAFSKMDNSNVALCIVGGGDDLDVVKSLTKSLGVDDKVYFVGFRKDTERFYWAAQYLVLPSYYEAFGNVVPEALIAGTPIVGFRTIPGKTLTALDELIENDKMGVLCNEYTVDALTHALNKAYLHCVSDNFKRDKQYCRDIALKKYNWTHFLEKILH